MATHFILLPDKLKALHEEQNNTVSYWSFLPRDVLIHHILPFLKLVIHSIKKKRSIIEDRETSSRNYILNLVFTLAVDNTNKKILLLTSDVNLTPFDSAKIMKSLLETMNRVLKKELTNMTVLDINHEQYLKEHYDIIINRMPTQNDWRHLSYLKAFGIYIQLR